jgi:hypothetical protein
MQRWVRMGELLSDGVSLKGRLTIRIENVDTNEIKTINKENLVILSGRNLIRDFLFGDTVTGLSHMALGTDTSDPTVTPGITEVFRKVFTSKVKADGKLTVDMYLSSQEANGHTISSAALFCNSGQTQYNKVIFDGISKNSSLAITFTWELLFNAG